MEIQDISDCLSLEAQNLAEARLAAKRAARAEAREIRMKELERQQKEIYQVQKKYYGLDNKWGDIEQWMEDSERYSHRLRRNPQASDEDDLMSVGSRSSLRTNGYEEELLGATQYRKSSRSSNGSGEIFQSSRATPRDEAMSTYYSDPSLASAPPSLKTQQAVHNGSRPSLLNCSTLPSRCQRGSLYDEGIASVTRRYSSSSSRPPSDYSCYLGSGSRASSRASSARASPVVEERPEKDFAEKASRPVSSLSAATLASLGGTSSRRGSGDTSLSVDTEASIREIKEISELKEQIEDVEGRYTNSLKEMKDSLAEVEEKYKRSMVTNAQLDNEKTSLVYQVDTLREVLLELEEELAESRRQYDEKHKECERQKHEQNVLRFQLTELKEALQQREEMLTEIRQLQQKQEHSAREIGDLKETIEWKDKKIGALERQKEFFDPVRSERDELREEVARLKEELKKRGVALDSRDTHNGDSSLEPHINDACLDPPLQGTSLGKTQEADEKKEEITVACQVPRSETEQDRNEVQANAPEEVSVHAESRGSKEEPINIETASGSVLETVFSDNCTVDGLQTSSNRHQDAPDSKDISREDAEENNDVEVQDIGNVLILDPCVTEVNGDSAQNPRDASPTESEDFEDALDFVAQNTDPARFQEASSISLNVYNNHAEGQIRQQEGVPVESRKCTVDNLPCDDHVVQEKEDSTLESKPVDSAAQKDKEDNAQSDDANNLQAKEFQENCKESSKCDGETGEENVAEVVSPCDELMVNQEPTERCENKSKDDSEGVQSEHSPNEDITKLNEITVLVDQKNKDEPLPSLESGEGDKDLSMAVHTVPSAVSDIRLDQDKSLTIEQSPQQTSLRGENVAVDQYGAERDVEHVVKCTESLGGGDENITPDATLATDLGCEKKIQINEISETTDLEEQEGKTKTSSEDLVPEDNGKKRINSTQSTEENRSETAQSESLSSEGENTQDDDDDDSDPNEDHSVPTEKYPGEREMPRTHIGSSVDRASSSEDVRVEESEGKNVKRGKGKNKEDCSLS